MDGEKQNAVGRSISIKLWPPSENTRANLVKRLTNNLSGVSIFTERYGHLSTEEAAENAKRIEVVAFDSANSLYDKEPDGNGGSAVQHYARECSKLLLEVIKRGPLIQEEEEDVLLNETCFDISTGQRAFLEAEEAEKLLKPLKEEGNSYVKICFSNRSFGLGAARVAVPVLVSIKDQLKEVVLSDFIAGRPEAEALEVMKMFSSALEGCALKSLDLSDNALGEKGVRAFGALLKSQISLEELYLMNDGISEEAARAVSELIPSTDKLRVLHFHNNMTGDDGALFISEVVKQSPSLEDFRCSSTRIGSDGGIALAEALEACIHLKKLDLRDNMFGIEAGIPLSKALSNQAKLTEVYLSYLNLENEGATAIANILKESAPLLQVLEMAGNDITAVAAPILAACLDEKVCLTKLNLSENELKDEGAILISKVLEKDNQLKEVDMSSNGIGRTGARVLAEAVIHKPGFVLLNINGNFISDEGIKGVEDIFKNYPNMLGRLDDNDPEGGGDEEDEVLQEKDDVDEEIESKLKILQVNQEE